MIKFWLLQYKSFEYDEIKIAVVHGRICEITRFLMEDKKQIVFILNISEDEFFDSIRMEGIMDMTDSLLIRSTKELH